MMWGNPNAYINGTNLSTGVTQNAAVVSALRSVAEFVMGEIGKLDKQQWLANLGAYEGVVQGFESYTSTHAEWKHLLYDAYHAFYNSNIALSYQQLNRVIEIIDDTIHEYQKRQGIIQ